MINQSSNQLINFKARKVQTTRIDTKKIDIYALNNTDSFFIERMKDISSFYTFPDDALKIGGETENGIVKSALDSVFDSKKNREEVLIAIENDAKICGILSLKKDLHFGIRNATINKMTVWQDTKDARNSLLLAAVNIYKKVFLDMTNITQPVFNFLKSAGGALTNNCQNILIESSKNLTVDINNIPKKRNTKVAMTRIHQSPLEYNLEEILKIC